MELYRLGPMELSVRSLDDATITGMRAPFVALLPATDLARLSAATSLVPALLDGGCVDIILAGARADAFQQRIGLLLKQRKAIAASSPYPDINDACNATLLGALVHHSGLALCLDDEELLQTLRVASQANGWTVTASKPKAKPLAKAKPKAKPSTPASMSKKAKGRR